MSTQRAHHPDPRLYDLVRSFVRLSIKLLTRTEVHGQENIPLHGPFIVATNHQSAVDPPLILAFIPAYITVFAADTHRHEFLIGELMNRLGAIWVKRGEADREALRAALQVLKKGGVIGIAPEGTRSRTGGLLKGRIGAAYLAAHANVPILPVALTGTEGGLPGVLRLTRPHITVTVGHPFLLPNPDGRLSRQDLDTFTDTIMLTLARMLPERYRGVYRDVVVDSQW